MSRARGILVEADRAPRFKAQLTLKQILDNTEKVLKGELKQDRDVKIRSVRPYAGTKWVRFDGRATGAENKAYDLTLIFYNVDFASERDTKHTIPVAVKGLGAPTEAVWMEPIRIDKHPAAVWCSCASFQFRSEWYLKEKGSLAAGRKPRPYQRKTTTRPSVNPKELPGACKHIYMAALKMRAQGYLK